MTFLPDIQHHLITEAERLADPEAIVVHVETFDSTLAIAAGPLVAERLHPARRFGEVIHIERCPDGYDVAVEDRGRRTRWTP